MQHRSAEEPQQDAAVWPRFCKLFLLAWDRDFIRRVLWKKLRIGSRMGQRVGSALCPLCSRLEDHTHVLCHCRFSAFVLDTVRKAFGLVQSEGCVEPSRLLLEEPCCRCKPHRDLCCGLH